MRRTIRKSATQVRDAKFARLLASLTAESEFIGITGLGYPTSFYRVFVRAKSRSTWWKLEVETTPKTTKLPAKGGVRGRLGDILTWSFKPDCLPIGRLFERARELGAQ